MVHCTLYCNLILAQGRSHNTLGVTILTGCSSGTLPKILSKDTASLPSVKSLAWSVSLDTASLPLHFWRHPISVAFYDRQQVQWVYSQFPHTTGSIFIFIITSIVSELGHGLDVPKQIILSDHCFGFKLVHNFHGPDALPGVKSPFRPWGIALLHGSPSSGFG